MKTVTKEIYWCEKCETIKETCELEEHTVKKIGEMDSVK